MARDILSEYGPESPNSQTPSMSKNGPAECKDLPYDPPKGPIGIGHKGVGLGGTNHGNSCDQGKH